MKRVFSLIAISSAIGLSYKAYLSSDTLRKREAYWPQWNQYFELKMTPALKEALSAKTVMMLVESNTDRTSDRKLILQRLEGVVGQLRTDRSVVKEKFRHLYDDSVHPDRCVRDVVGSIDHTLLKPVALKKEIEKLCDEALEYGFAAVCVNGSRVQTAIDYLHKNKARNEKKIKVAAVVGFPLGAGTPTAKAAEAEDLLRLGADELDMVINMGKLKDGDYLGVLEDISAVVKVSKKYPNTIVKVILECGALTKEEIIDGCIVSVLAGADFVKTSTGFGFGGAQRDHVALMKFAVGPLVQVKASGGVRTQEDALVMLGVGASRIGTSAGVDIAKGNKSVANY